MKNLFDITTREEAITFHNDFRKKLGQDIAAEITEEFGIFPVPFVNFSGRSMEISCPDLNGDRQTLFGSEVTIYRRDDNFDSTEIKYEINFGTTGSFNPHDGDSEAAVYRTRASFMFIQNWNKLTRMYAFYNEKLEAHTKIMDRIMKSVKRKEESENATS